MSCAAWHRRRNSESIRNPPLARRKGIFCVLIVKIYLHYEDFLCLSFVLPLWSEPALSGSECVVNDFGLPPFFPPFPMPALCKLSPASSPCNEKSFGSFLL